MGTWIARRTGRPTRAAGSVWEERHGETLVVSEEHSAGQRRGPVSFPHVVERRVERCAALTVERQGELDGVRVVKVADRDAHQGQAVLLDERPDGAQQDPHRGQDRRGVRRRPIHGVGAGDAARSHRGGGAG